MGRDHTYDDFIEDDTDYRRALSVFPESYIQSTSRAMLCFMGAALTHINYLRAPLCKEELLRTLRQLAAQANAGPFCARAFQAAVLQSDYEVPLDVLAALGPCVHLYVASPQCCPEGVVRLLDDAAQDPLERDAGARTLLELPSTSPEIAELLRDAVDEAPERALAVAMALHPRLGEASPLRLVSDVLRSLVLPFSAPRRDVRAVRCERLEVVQVDDNDWQETGWAEAYINEGLQFADMCEGLAKYKQSRLRSNANQLPSL